MARRRKHINPVPRWKNNAWHIVWRWKNNQYSLSTGLGNKVEDQKKAELLASDMMKWLAMEAPSFPVEWYASKGLERYMVARYGSMYPGEERVNRDASVWIEEYRTEIRQECIEEWADANISMLKALQENLGPLDKITPGNLSSYLAEVAEATSIPTRNRKRNAFSRFYRWAIRTHRTRINPVADIPVLTEPRITDIVYCTPAERDGIIQLAHRTGMKEWIAVPIAFYGGMRREEIAKLKWSDMRFDAGAITIIETKTKTSRTLPLNSTLEEYLRLIPKKKRSGYVVPSAYKKRVDGLIGLERAMERIVIAAFKQRHSAPRMPRKGGKTYRKMLKNRFNGNVAKMDECFKRECREWLEPIAPFLDRIRWNSFRHTFASLLVQSGVDIDTVAAWMGNTPEVCRRHYAQFIPRDRRDNRIDMI